MGIFSDLDQPLIIVVHHSPAMREVLRDIFEMHGLRVACYECCSGLDPSDLVKAKCLVVEVHDTDCLQFDLPMVAITQRGDVRGAVMAMQKGALDVIEAPIERAFLPKILERVLYFAAHERVLEVRLARERLRGLTPRERAVLDELVAGRSSKVAAHNLGISPRTVEVHRANLMEKMRARNLSDVLRIAITASVHPMLAQMA